MGAATLVLNQYSDLTKKAIYPRFWEGGLLTNTLKTFTPPQALKDATIRLTDTGSSSVKAYYMVLDAVNNNDAAAKIGISGYRMVLIPGEYYHIICPAGVRRIDFISAVAETGANILTITYGDLYA